MSSSTAQLPAFGLLQVLRHLRPGGIRESDVVTDSAGQLCSFSRPIWLESKLRAGNPLFYTRNSLSSVSVLLAHSDHPACVWGKMNV